MSKQVYSISYDNFYISEDIVTIDKIDDYIKSELDKEDNGEISSLFCSIIISEYKGYELLKQDNGDYILKLNIDDGDSHRVTLVKCNMFL